MKHKFPKTWPGFTLIELAFVLLIIGVIAGAVLKGQDLLETAKIRSILSDIHRYKIAIQLYQEQYGSLPGDDNLAVQHFGDNIPKGNGDGIISPQEAKHFWLHLQKAGHVSTATPPTSRLGGQYTVVHNPSKELTGHWLKLSGINEQGLLTPQQATLLKGKVSESTSSSDMISFIDGHNAGIHACLKKDGTLNLTHHKPTCVVLAAF
jgi:prepilin-type N-terminal cleavage/methylation domain-containing protein